MINNVTHITVLVLNQDEALKFYTEKLGFVKHTDLMFDEHRWLTVAPHNNPNFEIILQQALSELDKQIVGRQAGDNVFAAVTTDDCNKDYAELTKHGVNFMKEPEVQPWGTWAIFEDLYGNKFNLLELPKQA